MITLKLRKSRQVPNRWHELDEAQFVRLSGAIADFEAGVTTFEQIKGMAGAIFGWFEQNQDKLVGAYNFIQNLRGKGGIAAAGGPPAGIPPIPE